MINLTIENDKVNLNSPDLTLLSWSRFSMGKLQTSKQDKINVPIQTMWNTDI